MALAALESGAFPAIAEAQACGGCPAWCECTDDVCQPTPARFNALRLRTPDGRYLHVPASSDAFRRMVAARVGTPSRSETFLIASPTRWPLVSNDQIVLNAASSSWGASADTVRGEEQMYNCSSQTHVCSLRIGGPDTLVWIAPSCLGRMCMGGSADEERTFIIRKPSGGEIKSGDEVTLSTVYGWYFHTASDGSIRTDVEVQGPNTLYVVEFGQAVENQGWRPATVQCCGTVSGTVTDASTRSPIAAATTTADGTPFTAISGIDGKFTLRNVGNSTCVGGGPKTLRTDADMYQEGINPVSVASGSAIDVQVQLNCTIVSGRVIDASQQPVAGRRSISSIRTIRRT